MDRIAPEILDQVFSFLPYVEVYRVRAVSKTWQRKAELHFYTRLKCGHDTVTVQLDEDKSKKLSLYATHYDPDQKVIEFRPGNCTIDAVGPEPYSLVKIYFSQWLSYDDIHYREVRYSTGPRNPSDYYRHSYQPPREDEELDPSVESMIFHYISYNLAREQIHILSHGRRLIAGRGLMLAYAHTAEPQTDSEEERKKTIRIEWLRVTLAWLLSGFDDRVRVDHIYPEERIRLQTMLTAKQQRVFRSDPFAEPVLRFLLNPSQKVPTDVLEHARTYIEDDSSSLESRVRRLEHALECRNMDSRIAWKYSPFRPYKVKPGSLFDAEAAASRLGSIEMNWIKKRQELVDRARKEQETAKDHAKRG